MRTSAALLALALAACGTVDDAEPVGTPESLAQEQSELVAAGFDRQLLAFFGRRVFKRKTFRGNGRVCATCHLPDSGSITPADVEAAFQADPTDPLFRALDSDDGLGLTYDRLRTHATIRVGINLPQNVHLVDDPAAETVVLNRGVSSTINNPGIEPVLMQDGRNASLQEQAEGAINAHAEPGRQPRGWELDAVAAFQQLRRRFYSSDRLFDWALGYAPAPTLPAGNTPSEIRGRRFFEPNAGGLCTHCHGGEALNATNEFLLAPLPVGSRFISAAVSEFNTMGNPVIDFAFSDPADPNAPPVVISSPDPGRALITGRLEDVNAFRIPTLWGVADTAPYFHDNSAKTLEEMMAHYQAYFAAPPANIVLTDQDAADIIAYLKLLR